MYHYSAAHGLFRPTGEAKKIAFGGLSVLQQIILSPIGEAAITHCDVFANRCWGVAKR